MVRMGVMENPYESHCMHKVGKHHNIGHVYGLIQTWLAKNKQSVKFFVSLISQRDGHHKHYHGKVPKWKEHLDKSRITKDSISTPSIKSTKY